MDFVAPLVIGLFGSFHCVGMCGPIAVALPLKNKNWFSGILGGIIYNFGRIITYGVLGFIFGLLGRGIQLAGFQRWASVCLGIIMILSVMFPYVFKQKLKLSTLLTGYAYRLIGSAKRLFKIRSNRSLILIGLLNGLLPCGLVYVAIAGAINTNSVVMGIIFMALFGLGTVPLMLSVSMAGSIISLNLRNRMKRIVPYFIVLLGILFILRGMSLGIPYVSPKAEKLKPKEMVMKNEDCCM